ncbi:hypothetical protein BJF84_21000 [Rhodococcus sp. CUA-806]|nr:hypothetical protein BJF84_21000 [Rhodococcus sp. CUA-806]
MRPFYNAACSVSETECAEMQQYRGGVVAAVEQFLRGLGSRFAGARGEDRCGCVFPGAPIFSCGWVAAVRIAV